MTDDRTDEEQAAARNAAWADRNQAVKEAEQGMTLAQLRALPDDVLVQRFDVLAGPSDLHPHRRVFGPDDYLSELARRDAKRQGDRIEAMTRTITRLTWVITVLTAISVVSALVLLVNE